jgi:hypothetical protein
MFHGTEIGFGNDDSESPLEYEKKENGRLNQTIDRLRKENKELRELIKEIIKHPDDKSWIAKAKMIYLFT